MVSQFSYLILLIQSMYKLSPLFCTVSRRETKRIKIGDDVLQRDPPHRVALVHPVVRDVVERVRLEHDAVLAADEADLAIPPVGREDGGLPMISRIVGVSYGPTTTCCAIWCLRTALYLRGSGGLSN